MIRFAIFVTFAILSLAARIAWAEESYSQRQDWSSPASLVLSVALSPSELGAVSAFRWIGNRVEAVGASVAPDGATSLIRLEWPCHQSGTLLIGNGEWVGQPIEITAAQCSSDEPLVVKWLAAARLRGRVRVPRGDVLPPIGRLAIERCPSRVEVPPERYGDVPAVFSDTGEWSVHVPAGCLDVRLSVPPFAPERWAAVDAPPRSDVALREIVLVHGGALAVQAVEEETGHGLGGALVHLVPEQRLSIAAEAVLRGETVAEEHWTRTDADGWAYFERVPAGHFGLIARPPAGEDRAAAFSRTLRLLAGEQIVVPPLELPRPASLWVEVTELEVDATRPRRLVVDAVPLLEPEVPRFGNQVELDAQGTGLFEGLVPAHWQVSLVDRGSGETYSLLAKKEVLLSPGSRATVVFDSTADVYHGRIRWNGQPLAGRVTLHPDSVEYPRLHPAVDSDSEGRFRVSLPEPGSFTVEFRTPDLTFSSVATGVAFTDPDDQVDVTLPAGRIEGVVVDENGDPVPDALVRAEGLRESESGPPGRFPLSAVARADTAGAFALDALAEAAWTLVADAGQRQSGPQLVTVGRDELRPGVRLVVEEVRPVRLVVVSEHGEPVRAAEGVLVLPYPTHGRYFRTDDQGLAELRLHPSATDATVFLSASGHSRTLLRVPIKPHIRILLPRSSGRLELVPRPSWTASDLNHLSLVASDGACMPLSTIAGFGPGPVVPTPAPGSTRELVVPDLAPGVWRLARLSDAEAMMIGMVGGGLQLPALATVTVQPGVTMRLEIEAEELPDGPRSGRER